MALPSDSTTVEDWLRSLELWVWPMMATILMSGGLVFYSLAGLFWLAIHPAPTTVIWMMPPGVTETAGDRADTAIQFSSPKETMP
jgi:hypothetical protein